MGEENIRQGKWQEEKEQGEAGGEELKTVVFLCVCVGVHTQVYCEVRGFQRTRMSPTFFLRCLTFPELVK